MAKFDEPTKTVDRSTAPATNLSQFVFSDPQNFLETLKADFNRLSFGQEDLTLPLLQEYAEHGSDVKDRAAAKLAAQHFSELSDLYGQHRIGGQLPGAAITTRDIDFALDMERGRTLGYTLSNAFNDTAVGAGFGLSGYMVGSAGLTEAATGASIFGGEASAAITLGWLGIGVVGIGGAGYFGYEALTESRRMSAAAKKDQAMFRSWMVPSGGSDR